MAIYLLCHLYVSCPTWSLRGGRTTWPSQPCCSATIPRNSQCGQLMADESARLKETQHNLLPELCPCHALLPCRKASGPSPSIHAADVKEIMILNIPGSTAILFGTFLLVYPSCYFVNNRFIFHGIGKKSFQKVSCTLLPSNTGN